MKSHNWKLPDWKLLIALCGLQWAFVLFVVGVHWFHPTLTGTASALFCLLTAAGGSFYLVERQKLDREFRVVGDILRALAEKVEKQKRDFDGQNN